MKGLYYRREVDGEYVFSKLGCILAIVFSPLLIPLGLLWALLSGLTERSGLFNGSYRQNYPSIEQRHHRRFFRQNNLDPQTFWLTNAEYREVKIPKATGGERSLHIPSDELKALQTQLSTIFTRELDSKISKVAHAFRPFRSTVTNARPHLGCAVLIKLDIKDFFPSVTAEHVRPWLAKISYSNVIQDRLLDLTMCDQGLPQGAPTSPILSNLALKPFDTKLYSLCHFYGCKYTRYADDITISLEEDKSELIRLLIAMVENELAINGFKLNKQRQKLHVLRPHQAQRICGITINSGRPTIARKQRRLLRAAEHRLTAMGESSFSQNALLGWNSYVHMVHSANDCAWCNDERNAPKAVFCPQCEFVSKKQSSAGLRRHWRNQHSDKDLQTLPRCKYHQHLLT
jgi:retron-type reverse transcriptase